MVLDLKGRAVGLHFAGLYLEANYAVPASVLNQYISGKRWNQPANIETGTQPPRPSAPATPSDTQAQAVRSGDEIFVTIPLNIRVSLGSPDVASGAVSDSKPRDVASIERAVEAFWDARPKGVLAVRVGYFDEGDRIGERPYIAACVKPADLAAIEATGLREFHGAPVRYLPADVAPGSREWHVLIRNETLARCFRRHIE